MGVAGAEPCFEVGHIDARMMRERPRGRDALGERRQASGVLERIARRYHPPDAVEPDPVHRQQTGAAVRGVGRIEGPAEQSDPHARGVRRQDQAGMVHGKRKPGSGATTRATARGGEN